MTGRERLQKVFAGEIPDKVPHFELVFQIPEQAFGESWPTEEEFATAPSKKARDKLYARYFRIWEKIIETYDWAAVQLPVSLFGYYKGEVIPEGKKRFGNRAMIYDFNGQGTFWMPLGGDEMMEFVVKLFEEPDKLHQEAEEKKNKSIELAQYQVEQGVDFICINSDYGFNEGPFISPDKFSEFVTPYLTEIVEKIHEFGVPAILHSDGDLRLILDQLAAAGLDGYQSVDPQGHMDIAEVKKQYGDELVLMGNIQSSLLQDVDEQLIRENVRYAMKHGKPGGRYIFSTSNCVFDGMPLESYEIMLDEYEKHAYHDDGDN